MLAQQAVHKVKTFQLKNLKQIQERGPLPTKIFSEKKNFLKNIPGEKVRNIK